MRQRHTKRPKVVTAEEAVKAIALTLRMQITCHSG